MSDDAYARLKAIRDAIIHFKDSPLYAHRQAEAYFPVIGQGSHQARFMFVGESPSKTDAIYGRPYCGAEGELLDELLAGIELGREMVYLTYLVKDHPPDKRSPTPEEIEAYAPFLEQQIAIIQPRVVVSFGRSAMRYLCLKFKLPHWDKPIGKIHGQIFPVQNENGEAFFLPFFQPAYALYNQQKKALIRADFETLRQFNQD